MSGQIKDYIPPVWAENLDEKPSHYVSLASRPTITHELEVNGKKFEVARDDLTGSEMSGNKIRKLEFLLADCILNKKMKKVVTVGGVQSNHCRATVVACRRAGLEPYIVLNGTDKTADKLPIQGNIIFDKFFGARIFTETPEESRNEMANRLARELDAYAIPCGGTNKIGSWGYIQKWAELTSEGVLDQPKNIFVALGSGGTATGLILGNYLTGRKHKIHLIQVADTVHTGSGGIKSDMINIIRQFKLNGKSLNPDEVMEGTEIIDGIGLGYAVSRDSELEFIHNVAKSTGIFFDRVYSGKALIKMIEMMNNEKLGDCLFIHTGGIHSISDGPIVDFLRTTK